MTLSEKIESKAGGFNSSYEYIQLPLASGGHVNITLNSDGKLTIHLTKPTMAESRYLLVEEVLKEKE